MHYIITKNHYLEAWQSGLTRRSRKPVEEQSSRRFESSRFRMSKANEEAEQINCLVCARIRKPQSRQEAGRGGVASTYNYGG